MNRILNTTALLALSTLILLDCFACYSHNQERQMRLEVRRAAHKTPHRPRYWHYTHGTFIAERY